MRDQSRLINIFRKRGTWPWLGSIRLRLFLILISFTLLPILLIALFLGGLATRELRSKTNQLESTATLKENTLRDWIDGLYQVLNNELAHDELNRTSSLLERDEDSVAFRILYDAQTDIFRKVIESQDDFEEIFLINSEGKVILSSNKFNEGQDYRLNQTFNYGLKNPYLSPLILDQSTGAVNLIVAQPIRSTSGLPVGVLAARANFDQVKEIMLEETGVGNTGETYLIDTNGALLTPTQFGDDENPARTINSQPVTEALQNKVNGSASYQNYAGIPVIGAYRWNPEMEVVVLAEQSQAEAFATVRAAFRLLFWAGLISVIFAIVAAFLIGLNFSKPVIELTTTAEKIAGGNLNLRAETNRSDEIGTLAKAFNSMTAQLHNLIGNLEGRISERTRQLQNRSEQLLASAEVGKYATTILDTNQLIENVVNLIQKRFDLYYVGLFLVDEQRKWAELKAGTGKAGQAMLLRNHKLSINDTSMIGWCVSKNQSRIALEAKDDPVRLATPDLPETRSEAAIPLRSRGQVIGALSVQSTHPEAFDTETIAVFQTMADQVAIALDNARLFNETQKALEAAHRAYGELSHEAWLERIRSKPTALIHDQTGTRNLSNVPELNDDSIIAIPLKTRGRTIGYLNAKKRRQELAIEKDVSESSTSPALWQPDEISLLETLTDQLGAALDSARLFEETQKQAERERIVGEATSRMRATLDIQSVLKAAAREFRDALNLEEVEVRLSSKIEGSEKNRSDNGKHLDE